MATTETITVAVVRNEDGSLDVNGTLYNAEEKLLEKQSLESLQGETISRHVHAVFDMHVGKKLTIPSVQSSVLHLLMQENPENAAAIFDNFKEWQEAVRVFIRNAPEFDVAKGKGGGAFRVCDVPPKTEK
jgi:hypothetical protein